MYVPWKCSQCGNSSDAVPIGVTVSCKCGHIDYGCQDALSDEPQINGKPVPPHIVKRGMNYMEAFTRWALAGFPRRRADEIRRIRGICQGCGFFDGRICTHRNCGCTVKGGQALFKDKVRWQTEHCPIGDW